MPELPRQRTEPLPKPAWHGLFQEPAFDLRPSEEADMQEDTQDEELALR
ncbi:hypothetical protein [Streptomyces atratus]